MTTNSARGFFWLLCLALALGPRAASAQGDEGGVPTLTNFATFGAEYWHQTAPEAKFQEFRDTPRGGFLDRFLVTGDTGRVFWRASGFNVLHQDESAKLRFWDGVRIKMDASYVQIPHNFSFISRTPYYQVSPGVYVLPDSIQSRNQQKPTQYVQTMTDFLSTAALAPAGFRTDVSSARLAARPARGFQIEVKGTHRDRNGTKPYGASLGFSDAIELLEPIDQQMLDGDATASYQQGNIAVQATGGFSTFRNQVDFLQWDSPRSLTDQRNVNSSTGAVSYVTSKGRTDLYPDNNSVRGSLSFTARLPQQTAFTATAGVARNTQNDPWLPYTINSQILADHPVVMPDSSTHAKANVFTYDARLTSRLAPQVAGTLRFHRYDFNNKTPEHTFNGFSPYDGSFAADTVTTDPFGNAQNTFGADLDVTPVDMLTLGGTVERIERDHTFREIEKDAENAVQGEAQLRPTPQVMMRGTYRYGKRTPKAGPEGEVFLYDDYKNDLGVFTEQPRLRRFDVAERKQNKAETSLSLLPVDRVELSGTFGWLKNEYPGMDSTLVGTGTDSLFGLREQKQWTFITNATLHVLPQLDLGGGWGRGHNQTWQLSQESPGSAIASVDSLTWRAHLTDKNDFIYANATFAALAQRLLLTSGIQFSRSEGHFDLSNNRPVGSPNLAQSLPQTLYRTTDVTAEARYRVFADTDLGLRYAYEQFLVEDFAATDVPLLGVTGTSATAIYLGDEYQPYKSHQFAVLVTRRF